MFEDVDEELGVERRHPGLLSLAAQLSRDAQQAGAQRLGQGDEVVVDVEQRHESA